ncbi:ABC-type uncharacterized transport system permease subunit [Herbaspirillum sp. Sphag1AN]|uniref:cytochrome C assembly family protein n=1 Tax=unclassified Herbaspirillum TaxID=2624150 RepID=UPI0016187171|nr:MULTISPECIES: cytochrome c biogenesis protein CcsA [unclassified Herbaspirillum]MBB3213764.1 ABC-type uncharacterized transport system permease subunit [Herbaspirillum sp. Sphag1AN]MBB3246961.1 ABC-type uncharacterized transport system permease subunit [Herbaspirillum sp. Sphag64]
MRTYFFILAALLYLICAILPSERRVPISIGTVIGWLLHGGALISDMFAVDAVRVGFAVMLSATMWVSVAAYWLENRNFSLDSLRVLVLPVAAVAVVLPSMFPGNMVDLIGKSDWFLGHIAISILAYSTLTIAAFHAVLMVLQESRLHTRSRPLSGGWFAAALDRLPALLTMEKILFRLIGFGFVLLTLTVLSGVVFSEQLFGKPFRWDHKTIFTLLSWGLFGLLLAGRRWQGWRGRTALSFTLTGFAILLLAYVGSRFVLEVVLHRVLV